MFVTELFVTEANPGMIMHFSLWFSTTIHDPFRPTLDFLVLSLSLSPWEMESLQTKVFSCISSSNPIPQPKFNNFTLIKQVGYAPLWRRRSRSGGCLRFRASVSGGGHGTSQDGYSAVEDEEKEEKGLLLGRDRDSSGSVVAFHLIPQSGMCLCI